MIVGYILCIALGMVDFSSVGTAAMFSLPTPMHFGMSFNVGAIVTVCIVHIATVMENIGDTTSIVTTAEDRLPTQEELVKTIRGDALGSIFGAFYNGLPVCKEKQNAGVIVVL